MIIHVNALVAQMFISLVQSNPPEAISKMSDAEFAEFADTVSHLKDAVIAMDNLVPMYVEIQGDEPYVTSSIPDLP
jgi:hypothetical protein